MVTTIVQPTIMAPDIAQRIQDLANHLCMAAVLAETPVAEPDDIPDPDIPPQPVEEEEEDDEQA